MQEIPKAGGPSHGWRSADGVRMCATFKLATPAIRIMEKREAGAYSRSAANVNRLALIAAERSFRGADRT